MTKAPKPLSDRLGSSMIYVAWIIFLVILTMGFNNYLDKQRNPNQTVNNRFNQEGDVEVVLQRNRYGHYVANGFINEHRVTFLLDTGATMVSIPESLSKRLNLTKGSPFPVQTANGIVTVYSTKLEGVRIGQIELRNISASINPQMRGDEILLGMSFMKHLEMVQRGNELILRLPPVNII